jgi:hypothetical protein
LPLSQTVPTNAQQEHSLRLVIVVLAFAGVFLAYPSFVNAADAATFTLTPDTQGLTFTIQNLGLAGTDLYTADGLDDTYQVLLTLTTTTDYVDAGAGADLLAAFSLNLSPDGVQDASLVASPSGYSWTLHAGNKVPGNSAKCDGNGGGSLCVEEMASATDNLVLDANGVYSWLFDVDLDGSGFADTTGLDVGIGTLKKTGPRYAFHGTRSLDGVAGPLASTSKAPGSSSPTAGELDTPAAVAPVPEPRSLMLLGSGLLVVASRLRRRR